MIKKGTCAFGLYWAINVNGDAKCILKKAFEINDSTPRIVQVYNSAENDLNKIALSQKIKDFQNCNILVIAPEDFEKTVDSVIRC